MAKKKKKTTRKKSAPVEIKDRSPFWRLAAAVLLFVVALFVFLGGFGTGGPLPTGLFNGFFWVFGWAAYLAPVALIYWGVYKFSSEDHQIPPAKLTGIFAVLIFWAGWLFTAFAAKQPSGDYAGGHGGHVGSWLGGASLNMLDKFPASLLFLVLTLLAIFFAFGISPKVLMKLGGLFKRPERDADTDLADLKARAAEPTGFKLKAGVPMEQGNDSEDKPDNGKEKPRLSSFRNSIASSPADSEKEALTTASDPDWQFPSIDLLNQKQEKANAGDVNAKAQQIHDTLAHFGVDVEMEGATVGPRITQYRLRAATGVKLNKITALENNLGYELAAQSIRIEAPIPGERAVGIELPNKKSAIVRVSSLLQSKQWHDLNSKPLGFVIGKDITGDPVVENLAKMPHMLVAGQTGSGKSVMINTILTSMLYHNGPSDLKLILVDPKQVELTPYNDIPHLLTPVITEPEKCISALKWAVAEMERRLKTMSAAARRSIEDYNTLQEKNGEEGMPHIVIVIDELSDLMMMAARDVEALIVRIAQKARAAGIHLVLATQRPSVNVITGLIKANVPGRIAFKTQSQIDSRTILDMGGAEKLLGSGDMLLKTDELPKPKRVQGAFVGDDETAKIVQFLKDQREPQYNDEVVSQPVQIGKGGVVADVGASDVEDNMWRDAVQCVVESQKASTNFLQMRLRIGYGRAARIIEQMEEQGIVGPSNGAKGRQVIATSMDEVFGSPNSESSVDIEAEASATE